MKIRQGNAQGYEKVKRESEQLRVKIKVLSAEVNIPGVNLPSKDDMGFFQSRVNVFSVFRGTGTLRLTAPYHGLGEISPSG